MPDLGENHIQLLDGAQLVNCRSSPTAGTFSNLVTTSNIFEITKVLHSGEGKFFLHIKSSNLIPGPV